MNNEISTNVARALICDMARPHQSNDAREPRLHDQFS